MTRRTMLHLRRFRTSLCICNWRLRTLLRRWSQNRCSEKLLIACPALLNHQRSSMMPGGVSNYRMLWVGFPHHEVGSSRHRSREEHARQIQLDLTAFPVFVEALSEEEREAATIWMAERSFVGAKVSPPAETDAGPTLLSQFIVRRRNTDEEGE